MLYSRHHIVDNTASYKDSMKKKVLNYSQSNIKGKIISGPKSTLFQLHVQHPNTLAQFKESTNSISQLVKWKTT